MTLIFARALSPRVQSIADRRADRNTPCRLGSDGIWKTIDEYLPMLKYGTQLHNPTAPVVRSEDPAFYGTRPLSTKNPASEGHRITPVDIDLPFVSILKLTFKWMAAAMIASACLFPVLMLVVFVIMAIFGSLLGYLFSGFPRP
jgi:hypothetical protein